MTTIPNNPFANVGLYDLMKPTAAEAPAPAAAAKTAAPASKSEGVQHVTALLSNETISAVYEASKNIGSTDTRPVDNTPKPKSDGEIAKEKFLEYMSMSPQELFFTLKLEAKLKSMHMTMEEFEALPPEEQNKIIEEVKREIEEEAKQKAENDVKKAQAKLEVQKQKQVSGALAPTEATDIAVEDVEKQVKSWWQPRKEDKNPDKV